MTGELLTLYQIQVRARVEYAHRRGSALPPEHVEGSKLPFLLTTSFHNKKSRSDTSHYSRLVSFLDQRDVPLGRETAETNGRTYRTLKATLLSSVKLATNEVSESNSDQRPMPSLEDYSCLLACSDTDGLDGSGKTA